MRAILATLLACSVALTSCEDGKPIVLRTDSTASPDGRWKAVLEEVDNGLGFGLGALYEEVHVIKDGEAVAAHGDPEKSVVFYADSTQLKGRPAQLKWLSPKVLEISLEPGRSVGKHMSAYRGIQINVVFFSPAQK